ncbi:unnamed protein product [Orchesella dallaii]|uniref:Carboxylesterase type B domain-containing protein n=1 Tax=Orchesella dallaii TaxID=48710 RepID=A0ABP1QVU5_9HEXA
MISSTNVAKGLYRSAISFSGSAAHHWALQTPQQARKITHHFAKRLGCPTNDGSKALLDCLRRVEPNFLVASQNNLIEYFGFPAVIFAPVIEQNVTGAFITESTESAYANGNVAKIPFLCTTTAEEMEYALIIMKNALVVGHLIRNWVLRAPLILDIRDYVDNPEQVIREIRDVYLRDVPPEYRNAVLDSNVKRYAKMGTDRYFTLGNRRALKLHGGVAPTYSYIFKFTSQFGVANFLSRDYKNWGRK